MRLSIVTSTEEHVKSLYNNFRAKDRLECEKLGYEPKNALYHSYKHALIRRTALINDRVSAMWGVVGTPLGLVGQPYLLTSPEVYKISTFRFVKIYRKEIQAMLQIFPILENYVDSEYPEAIRLLELIGFSIDYDNPYKVRDSMFLKFTLKGFV